MDFFAQLQSVGEITVGEMAAITICHGSPNKINAKMLPNEETGDCVWPDIPERYWAQAVNEFIT